MLCSKSRPGNQGPIDRTVIHVYTNRISGYLIIFIPNDREFIHVKERIYRRKLHRITNSLRIYPKKSHTMIGLQKTGGIGQYQVRFKSIGMQIQRIASRKLQQACRICRKRILGSFIVETILPFHNHRTNGVVEHHITEHFAESRSPIVKNRISCKALSFRRNQRTIQKHRFISFGIIPTRRRINDITI